MLGKTFSKLRVIAYAGRSKKYNNRQYLVECSCVNNTRFIVLENSLKTGNVKSCGCTRIEGNRNRLKTHGMTKTSEYKAWRNIRARCYDKNNASYNEYGARGITVDDTWFNDFIVFYNDMGSKPSKYHSIDRIDVNSNYCKENCKWSTATEQDRNRRVLKSNITGYHGIRIYNIKNSVYYGKYQVTIGDKRRSIKIGYYDNIKDAIASRQQSEIKYWREVITKYPIKIYQ